MKKIAILGLLVVIMPFLGFPVGWENIIYIILGALVFLQAVYLSIKTDSKKTITIEEKRDDVYIENDGQEFK